MELKVLRTCRNRQILPEALYYVDESMTLERLKIISALDVTITGKVLDYSNNIMRVYLGGGLIGYMPLAEATIYPIFNKKGLISQSILYLVSNSIRVKVSCVEPGHILLSRKKNMMSVLNTNIINKQFFEKCCITGFSKNLCFVDVGDGILGKISFDEFSYSHFNNIRDLGFAKNEIIMCTVLSFNPIEHNFILSRVNTLPTINEDVVKIGDIIPCIITGKTLLSRTLTDGYFVCIYSYLEGIVNVPHNIKLRYGDMIKSRVRFINDKYIKLTFIEKKL